MKKFGRIILRDELDGNGNDLSGAGEAITNEEEALASLVGGNEQPQENVVPEANIQANEGGEDNIDLSGVDLSFLGIEAQNNEQQAPGEIVENPAPNPNEQPNQIDEIKEMISNIGNPNDPEKPNLSEEQIAGAKEIFNLLQDAGLLPKQFGLSEEQETLLKDAQSIKDGMQQQETEQKEYEEHQTKLSGLEDFSKKLETTIPGYSTDFMQKVIGDIQGKNPEAAQKIFNNPSLLIDLWNSVGAKAQPSTEQSNVIGGNSQQVSQHNDLDEKVKNGTATEMEEAQWLRGA
jgi:hypothetical protein